MDDRHKLQPQPRLYQLPEYLQFILPQGVLLLFDTIANYQHQRQYGGTHADMITGQWDFEDPIKSSMKLEVGARTNLQRQYSNLDVVKCRQLVQRIEPQPYQHLQDRSND